MNPFQRLMNDFIQEEGITKSILCELIGTTYRRYREWELMKNNPFKFQEKRWIPAIKELRNTILIKKGIDIKDIFDGKTP